MLQLYSGTIEQCIRFVELQEKYDRRILICRRNKIVTVDKVQ